MIRLLVVFLIIYLALNLIRVLRTLLAIRRVNARKGRSGGEVEGFRGGEIEEAKFEDLHKDK